MASRPLHDAEQELLRSVFSDSIALDRVRLTRDHPFAFYAPKALGNTVHLRSDWGLFADHDLRLSERGMSELVHGLVHVWRYQGAGLSSVVTSLVAQRRAWTDRGVRLPAYQWQGALAAGLPFSRWNPEQQAQAVQDWWDAGVRTGRVDERSGDAALRSSLEPILEQVRAGRRGGVRPR